MKAIVFGVAAVLATVGAAQAQDVVIGAGFSLSGPLASYGEDGRRGADIAAEEINEAGGVLGMTLRIDYEDTGGSPAKAVAVFRKFASDPDAVAMISISSTEFVALNPVAAQVDLPLVSVGSSVAIDKFESCVFRNTLIVSQAMPYVLGEVKSKTGAQTIAVIYDNANAYTVGEMESVKAAAAAAGLDLVDVEAFSTGEQNFTLQLSNLAAANPDILYVAATTDAASIIISQSRAIGLESSMLGGAGLNDPRIGQLPGDAVRGVMTYFSFDPNDPRDFAQRFIERYKAKYDGETPAAYTALGYDGVRLIADAVARAGSTDRDAICKALGKTTNFEGLNGTYNYDGDGDNTTQEAKLFQFGEHGLERLK